MKPGPAGWLFVLLSEEAVSHRAEKVVQAPEREWRGGSARARARAYLRRMLRETGLLFGTPALSGKPEVKTAGQELSSAVVRTFARLALDISVLVEGRPGPRREQLLLLFSVLAGELEEAKRIEAWIQGGPFPEGAWALVEDALERRSISFSGDPVYALMLHNSAVYADAQVFGRQTIAYFGGGRLSPPSAQRRLRWAGRQKALLVQVLLALASAERRLNFSARRAILRRIENLQLPAALAARVRGEIKKSFEGRVPLEDLLRQVRGGDVRRFILEQTILASLVNGRRSARELAFIQELSTALGVSPQRLGRIEIEVAEFYARNRGVVDVFAVSEGAGQLGEQVVESIQRTLEKNFYALLREIRQTGELSVLLTRAARGQKLTAEEKQKVRAQLIDIAKAIPALAIFAAPGGVLLLIALAKVLPFNILPSAFQDEESAEAERKARL